MRKTCKSCAHCKTLYHIWTYGIREYGSNYCADCEGLIEPDYYCDRWIEKTPQNAFSKHRFDELQSDIKRIKAELINSNLL